MNRFILLAIGCVLFAGPSVFLESGQASKDEANPKTSQNGVDFEVISSKMSGNNWEVTLSAFTEEGNKRVRFTKSRALTEDGKTYENQFLKMKGLNLPLGQRIQIKLDLGPLPASVNKLATVELQDFFAKGKATVFKNVRVDR